MDDLISRKALLEAIENADTDITADYGEYYGSESGFSRESIKNIIKGCQAVDAAPVVHGWWVAMHYEGGILDGANCERCSNCGWDRFFDEPEIKSVFRYCPKCGALMDGGNDND